MFPRASSFQRGTLEHSVLSTPCALIIIVSLTWSRVLLSCLLSDHDFIFTKDIYINIYIYVCFCCFLCPCRLLPKMQASTESPVTSNTTTNTTTVTKSKEQILIQSEELLSLISVTLIFESQPVFYDIRCLHLISDSHLFTITQNQILWVRHSLIWSADGCCSKSSYFTRLRARVSERAFGSCRRAPTSPRRINTLHSGCDAWSVTYKCTQRVNALIVSPQAPGRWSPSSSSASSSSSPFCWSSSRRTTGGAAFLPDVAKYLRSECFQTHSRAIFTNMPAVALVEHMPRVQKKPFLACEASSRRQASASCTRSRTNTRLVSWNVR